MKSINDPKIAIIKLSAMGDIVHSVVVLQFIKKHYPNAHITWIVDTKFAQLLRGTPGIDRIVALPLKDKKYFKSFKILFTLGKFDAVIDLQGLIKSALVAKLISGEIYGFSRESVKEKFASHFYDKQLEIDYNKNIIIRNLSLSAFALDFNFHKDEILAKRPCFGEYNKIQNQPKRILIAPFASEESKVYDKFDEVVRGLSEFEIFIAHSSPAEFEKAKLIAKDTKAKILEKQSLKQLIEFISQCDLVIGNDSGVTHIAWAQNVASITLFGNRPSHRNAYATSKNLVLDMGKKIDARSIDKNDFCIRKIYAETIINHAKRLLANA
ncbi:MAG: lipopolysaccharide heptosyltransferase I [Campylobacter sp.]|nr:lipopolysaccharide heptosyltransferase I [Campylobacter sp.]